MLQSFVALGSTTTSFGCLTLRHFDHSIPLFPLGLHRRYNGHIDSHKCECKIAMSIAEPTTKQWTRAEYYRLGELGWFVDQRTELIGGEIFIVDPQTSGHYATLDRIAELLSDCFGEDYWIRIQGPMTLANDSEPEPDVSVVRGTRDDYEDHPTMAELIVEVSATTLAFDQREKASLYAFAGISDYWIVNLAGRQVEVRREPVVDESQKFGHRYNQIQVFGEDADINPLNEQAGAVRVADIF